MLLFFWHLKIVDLKWGNYGLFENLTEVVVPTADYILIGVVVISTKSSFHLWITSFVCWQWLIDC